MAAADRKASRVITAPGTQAEQRSSRGSTLLGWRASQASSSLLERHLSVGSLKGLLEVVPKPSPAALRLKSLARAFRASQTLGTLRVRNKYVVSASKFSTEEMNLGMDLRMMIDDTSSFGTAPWASSTTGNSSNNKSERSEGSGRSLPSSMAASTKSKARWKNAGKAAGQLAAALNNDSNDGSPLNLSPGKSPMLRRTNDTRSFKPAVKHLDLIRGDLNMLLNGGSLDGQASQQQAIVQRTELPENLDARIFCARSLYKLSCQVGSELAIIQGGAIAQIADFNDVEHPKLLRFCAATLTNLTIDNSVMEAFVKNDGIQALLEPS